MNGSTSTTRITPAPWPERTETCAGCCRDRPRELRRGRSCRWTDSGLRLGSLCGVRDGSSTFWRTDSDLQRGPLLNTNGARTPGHAACRRSHGIRNPLVRSPHSIAGSRKATHTAPAEVFFLTMLITFSFFLPSHQLPKRLTHAIGTASVSTRSGERGIRFRPQDILTEISLTRASAVNRSPATASGECGLTAWCQSFHR